MTPWCDDLVCSWRRLLADRHSLPFPWTLSLHRRWCPSASHHPLTFLFLLALTFPLPSPFPSLGLSLWGGGGANHIQQSTERDYSRAMAFCRCSDPLPLQGHEGEALQERDAGS